MALFLATYIAVYYRIWFTERGEPANLVAMRIHTITGVAWPIGQRAPSPELPCC